MTVAADRTPSGRPWCTFCSRVGYTQDRCYKRLGITPAGKGRGRGRGPCVIQPTSIGALSSATDAAYRGAFGTHDCPASHSGPSANQVQRLLALLDTPTPSTEPLTGQQPAQFPPWLIDSGASHPMTGPHYEEPDWTG